MIMKREDVQALTHNMITHPRVLRDALGDLQGTREEADDLTTGTKRRHSRS